MDLPSSLEPDRIQPSQLYISQKKLDAVLSLFDEAREQEMEPIPIKRLDDELVSTDGHTRGLAWYLNGYEKVPVEVETMELEWEGYRICVEWCKSEGIGSIPDLQDRVVDHRTYQKVWLDRCRIMQDELAENRSL